MQSCSEAWEYLFSDLLRHLRLLQTCTSLTSWKQSLAAWRVRANDGLDGQAGAGGVRVSALAGGVRG